MSTLYPFTLGPIDPVIIDFARDIRSPSARGCLDASHGQDWVRKLASASSHAEHYWRDLARGLRDVDELRSAPPGEEVVPKPAKDKIRRRASPSDTPEPKKSKARKTKDDSAALSTDVAQKLRDEEEEGKNAGYKLVPRKRASVEAPKAAGPVMVEETYPWPEEISEGAPSKVPESSGAEDISYHDEKPVSVPEGSGSRALQKRESALSDLLGAININDSPPALNFLKGYDTSSGSVHQISSRAEPQKLERIELLRGEVDKIKVDCDRSKENMDCLTAEKEATLAKLSSAEELEAELAEAKAEVKKTKITTDKSIAVYLDDVEADQTQLREASDQEKWSNDLAKCQSRRETLKVIHARGFDLSKKIAQAKALEADARLLISSDDDDDNEGSRDGSNNDEGPEGEASPEGETSP
uniref:Uncharacterized protein LOC104215741 n=1 Tax=Nicotiana sylvestris TaxID=4096 RepID=A0A1U7VC24_NICSY|nr:PREDICTED: uncharacterized protein LOC104215741 [Nicotiana sylvestris]